MKLSPPRFFLSFCTDIRIDMIPTDFKAMEAAPMVGPLQFFRPNNAALTDPIQLEPTPPTSIRLRAKKPRRIFRFLGAINPLRVCFLHGHICSMISRLTFSKCFSPTL